MGRGLQLSVPVEKAPAPALANAAKLLSRRTESVCQVVRSFAAGRSLYRKNSPEELSRCLKTTGTTGRASLPATGTETPYQLLATQYNIGGGL